MYNKSDKKIILEIVTQSFLDNPRIRTIIKRKDPQKKIRVMAEYAYTLIERLNGVYLSEDKTTVIFYYRKSLFKRSFTDSIRYIRMFLLCIKPSELIKTYKREKYIESLRPDLDDYIYVWVLGSVKNNDSLKGLADIRDHLFGFSEKTQLPVLIETTVKRMLGFYRYVGFKVYKEWYDEEDELKVWLLKREPIKEQSHETS